jgi:hypothetical protein
MLKLRGGNADTSAGESRDFVAHQIVFAEAHEY